MLNLTRQQQWVLCTVLGLLLLGWLVKTWRTTRDAVPADPPSAASAGSVAAELSDP